MQNSNFDFEVNWKLPVQFLQQLFQATSQGRGGTADRHQLRGKPGHQVSGGDLGPQR